MNTVIEQVAESGKPMNQSVSQVDKSVEGLFERLKSKEDEIALVGLGYVGLPLALEFAKSYKVIGYDINDSRVEMMNNNCDPSGELKEEEFLNREIRFTSRSEDLKKASMIIVAVPTPVGKDKQPDLSPIQNACVNVGSSLNKGDVVVFESTVYPGCTEEVCVPILEELSGLTYNVDFKVGYSPERINPGDKDNTLCSITKIVSGSDEEAAQEIYKLYDSIITAGIHLAPSMKVAEAAKIVENTQRDVNIALMNELSCLFDTLDINTQDVLTAAGTKWNFLNFFPGLVGGHCIGVDPYYLIHKGDQVGLQLDLMKASRQINDSMPTEVVKRVDAHLLAQGKQMANSKILVLGATFKENVTDMRNSKAAELSQILDEECGELHVVDPYADSDQVNQYYGLDLQQIIEDSYDAVIYAVDHQQFRGIDWEFINHITAENAVICDFKKKLGIPADPSFSYITL